MIVQGQMPMPFPGLRGPFFMQGQQVMAGPHQFFIMQPVTGHDLHGMGAQFFPQGHQNQSNPRHTDGKK